MATNIKARIIATLFTSAIGVAMLTGCDDFSEGYAQGSGSGPQTQAPATNVVPATEETRVDTPDERFIMLLDNAGEITDGEVTIEYGGVESEMIDFGRAICTDLNDGTYSTGTEAAIDLYLSDTDNLFTQDEIIYIVAASINSYCPDEE
ncbi:hypothetical protein PBI_KAMPE_95 [Gordonia phage Kampe]|uniref:DUF732 domain-containing protein n=3 Tax=Gordonia phage Orchid TaxID=1838075 RepID=A0A160DHF1_9CAUD|nr:hypothetical protein BH761_gp094 [Gordonia phage Orchid]ANA87329.1 hypothetical protein PBI_PATRICKSTAR_95 [Gordonia phage PatrickStar]ANA87440.1 hypothetical protein PBI_ORCHID_94 [Gordonia phage Orchid]ANA87555.1 hypothetical protein PBI_KAMPE_95 [Gordonia phage Kampe]